MNGYVKRMATIVAAVFTLALVLAACGGSVDEGQVISFEGKDLNGNVVNSEELFGSHDVTMVNLWSSTCQGCEDELGELSDLNDRVNPAGGCVIGLIMDTDMDDAVEKCRAKLEQHGATYINIPATEQMRKDSGNQHLSAHLLCRFRRQGARQHNGESGPCGLRE